MTSAPRHTPLLSPDFGSFGSSSQSPQNGDKCQSLLGFPLADTLVPGSLLDTNPNSTQSDLPGVHSPPHLPLCFQMPPPHQVRFLSTSRLCQMYTLILDHSWDIQFSHSKTNEVSGQTPTCLKQTEAGEQAHTDGQGQQGRTSSPTGSARHKSEKEGW